MAMHLDNLDDMSKENGFSPHQLAEIITITEQSKLSKYIKNMDSVVSNTFGKEFSMMHWCCKMLILELAK